MQENNISSLNGLAAFFEARKEIKKVDLQHTPVKDEPEPQTKQESPKSDDTFMFQVIC